MKLHREVASAIAIVLVPVAIYGEGIKGIRSADGNGGGRILKGGKDKADEGLEEPLDILARAKEIGGLDIFLDLVKAADLDKTLEDEGPWTVFAPHDSIFEGCPLLDFLERNEDVSAALLLQHVVAEEVLATDMDDGDKLLTLDGRNVTVALTDGNITIGKANVLEPNWLASNGVIHVIDGIIRPDKL